MWRAAVQAGSDTDPATAFGRPAVINLIKLPTAASRVVLQKQFCRRNRTNRQSPSVGSVLGMALRLPAPPTSFS